MSIKLACCYGIKRNTWLIIFSVRNNKTARTYGTFKDKYWNRIRFITHIRHPTFNSRHLPVYPEKTVANFVIYYHIAELIDNILHIILIMMINRLIHCTSAKILRRRSAQCNLYNWRPKCVMFVRRLTINIWRVWCTQMQFAIVILNIVIKMSFLLIYCNPRSYYMTIVNIHKLNF